MHQPQVSEHIASLATSIYRELQGCKCTETDNKHKSIANIF
uniref:Uncharacterized protein n=1 Tax=Anguilla anguilla TaxID=7936 RepID=A0A0E9S844_ANGAN